MYDGLIHVLAYTWHYIAKVFACAACSPGCSCVVEYLVIERFCTIRDSVLLSKSRSNHCQKFLKGCGIHSHEILVAGRVQFAKLMLYLMESTLCLTIQDPLLNPKTTISSFNPSCSRYIQDHQQHCTCSYHDILDGNIVQPNEQQRCKVYLFCLCFLQHCCPQL